MITSETQQRKKKKNNKRRTKLAMLASSTKMSIRMGRNEKKKSVACELLRLTNVKLKKKPKNQQRTMIAENRKTRMLFIISFIQVFHGRALSILFYAFIFSSFLSLPSSSFLSSFLFLPSSVSYTAVGRWVSPRWVERTSSLVSHDASRRAQTDGSERFSLWPFTFHFSSLLSFPF